MHLQRAALPCFQQRALVTPPVDKLPHLLSTIQHPKYERSLSQGRLLFASKLPQLKLTSCPEQKQRGQRPSCQNSGAKNARIDGTGQVESAGRASWSPSAPPYTAKAQVAKIPRLIRMRQSLPTCPAPSIWAFSDEKSDNMPPENPEGDIGATSRRKQTQRTRQTPTRRPPKAPASQMDELEQTSVPK